MNQYEVRATNDFNEEVIIHYSDFTAARAKVMEFRARQYEGVQLFERLIPPWKEVIVE